MSSNPTRLYRSILRLHRQKLPAQMRRLGDTYVREEFKRHKDAKPDFVPTFMVEWEKYRDMLMSQKNEVGADLTASQTAALSPEQTEQLQKLKEETEAAMKGETTESPVEVEVLSSTK